MPSFPQKYGFENARKQCVVQSTFPRALRPLASQSGSEKGVFWKRGLFRKVHFEILENLEILEILQNCQTVENEGEADHFLETLENLEILEIPPVKRPLS